MFVNYIKNLSLIGSQTHSLKVVITPLRAKPSKPYACKLELTFL